MTARLYECRITHARMAPLNVFTYRTYLWLVDLDQLPCFRLLGPGLLASFESRDHLGDPPRASARTSTTSWRRTGSTWGAAG